MLTRDQAAALSNKILSYSTLPECSVSVAESENAFVRFANNGITTSGLVLERSVSVSSTRDGKTGTAQTTETSEEALRAVVARSEELAALSPVNAEHMPPLGPQQYPTIEAMDPWTASSAQAVLVPHVQAAIRAAAAKKLVAAGFYERVTTSSGIANKKKLFGFHQSADASMSTTVRTPDGSSSGWAGRPSANIREINGLDLANAAIEKCLKWKNPRKLEPGEYTVVLEPTAVSDLVANLPFSFSARSAEEGRSFLSKKGGGTLGGEKLFPETITLATDPFDERHPGAPWSAGGIPNRKIAWVEGGTVKSLYYDRYWAGKTEKRATPTPNSLVMGGTEAALDELIQGTERGLLVTRFWYIRIVNAQTLQLTGLTRDGLFLIENGEIAAPVMNLRFNESPVRMLQNTRRLGQAVRARGGEGGGMIAPSLVADEFTFSSISDAV